MIEEYFEQIEHTIRKFPIIRSYSLTTKIYNAKQGYIQGNIIFEDGTILAFVEVKNTDIKEKITYRYQYMDEKYVPIFRYDNAPHHKGLSTFPHHKHIQHEIQEHVEPVIDDILLEIALKMRG